jgi:hypothetical protein
MARVEVDFVRAVRGGLLSSRGLLTGAVDDPTDVVLRAEPGTLRLVAGPASVSVR